MKKFFIIIAQFFFIFFTLIGIGFSYEWTGIDMYRAFIIAIIYTIYSIITNIIKFINIKRA